MVSQSDSARTTTTPIGIIAGGGHLPVRLLEALRVQDQPAIVISISQAPNPQLQTLAREFHHLSPGQLRKIIRTFRRHDVADIVMIGSVRKTQLFHPRRFDTLALTILAHTKQRGDRSLLGAIADAFEERGLRVLDQRRYLSSLLPRSGVLTSQRLSQEMLRDIEQGMQLARQMATLDIGQTVVLKQGVVVAVEAVEGTDAAIERGASLAGDGIVVAKASHPEHDFRFDVPTVGPETLQLLQRVHASALAIEAGRAFLVDREETVALAESAGISLVVWESP